MKRDIGTKETEKVLYGSVAILRAYCNDCDTEAFIISGLLQCCDRPYKIPEKINLQREIEGKHKRGYIPAKVKRKILKQQKNKCIYCGEDLDGFIHNKKKDRVVELRTHFDHFVSWNYSRNDGKSNLVASCQICNGIKSDHYFQNITCARKYILERRKEKGY